LRSVEGADLRIETGTRSVLLRHSWHRAHRRRNAQKHSHDSSSLDQKDPVAWPRLSTHAVGKGTRLPQHSARNSSSAIRGQGAAALPMPPYIAPQHRPMREKSRSRCFACESASARSRRHSLESLRQWAFSESSAMKVMFFAASIADDHVLGTRALSVK